MELEIATVIGPLVGRIIMTVLAVGALAVVAHAAAVYFGSTTRR